MSLPAAMWQVRQFLPRHHLADLEDYPAMSPEEVATIDVLTGDMGGEVD